MTAEQIDLSQKISNQIGDIIKNDTFPNDIQPEALRAAVRSYPERGGKRLRPYLLMTACGMCGGDPQKARYAAAAVEIFHNWTLVHDDIIDCDALRRGAPTCHIEAGRYCKSHFSVNSGLSDSYGRSIAILAGDLQQSWAGAMLLRIVEDGASADLALALMRRMQRCLSVELISGEALDVEFEVRDHAKVHEEDVLHMIYGKTSALLAYAMQCGAAIALNSADFDLPQQQHILYYAHSLGYAYQLLDDLLGVYGEPERFGKPLCSDFKERKPTILYIEAKKRMSAADAMKLESMMGLPFYSGEMVAAIRNMLVACGAKKAVEDMAHEATAVALQHLESFTDGPYKTALIDLTNQLVVRGN